MAQSSTLMEQLAAHVKHGDHLCVICENAQDRLNAAAQYIADGLRQNEFVMYAADAQTTEILRGTLAKWGIDVEAEVARGALNMPTAYEAYLRDGEFNPDLIYEAFDQAITTALSAGFTGCRFAGEPIWAIDREELRPGLIEFENRLNGLFRSRKAAGLCVYDKTAWPATVVRDVLRTHPVAVVDDLVCNRNLYYERPDLHAGEASAEFQVSWMLSQLRELQAQEAKLQVALEAGRLGSWELDLSTDNAVRSLRHDQIFGYDRPPANWGYEVFMQHVLPEDREHVDTAFRQALENGSTWHFECRIRRQNDKSVRWIEAHGRPEPASSAKGARRWLGIVADITERKEMEQALRDADRRKDEFLATLAHELRNPLAPILNALQVVQLKTEADPQVQKACGVMERQARHLVRLVDDLLEVSRITTGRIVLQRAEITLQNVLANAIEASQPLIQASGHRFSVDVPDEPLYLLGDATRLAQVFLNILNNAAKYTPAGGRIALSAGRDGDLVFVRVRDNGYGITKDLLPDVFEMFVQGHQLGQHAQGGLGIGLPLARRLIELHGGTIEASSAGPGQGSEFLVRLPAASVEQDGHPSGQPGPTETPGRMRILIVDDNVDAADSLSAFLEILGHEVQTRYDGQAALAYVPVYDPDVVILDIGLPGLDGYEVARRLRVLKPHLRLVALTGWGQEKDREQARAAGFDLHRTKPVDPTELVTAIAALPPGGTPATRP